MKMGPNCVHCFKTQEEQQQLAFIHLAKKKRKQKNEDA